MSHYQHSQSAISVVDAAVGRALRRRRQERNLSVEQIASRLSLSPRYYEAVEAGLSRPSPSQIIDLTQALDLRVVDLFEELTEGR